MSRTAISVEGLSKLYRIGLAEQRHESLVSAALDMAKLPLRNFRKLWRLDTSGSGAEEEDDLIWALRDVSFEVNRGEVLGIIGRNGAGKSTLLKILSRVTAPTSGRVVVDGRISSLLEVGTGFHMELTGRDNIYLNGTILGMTKREIDRKFDEIVEFSGVEKFLDTPIKRYSSGMKVRLAFSVAAHLEPDILIIDEVLAVGDVEFQNKCMGKMQDVTEKGGRTVLFVSHNMNAINRLCTRGIVMKDGGVIFDGPTSEAARCYMEQFSTATNRFSSPFREGLEGQLVGVELQDEAGEPIPGEIDTDRACRIKITAHMANESPTAFLTVSLRDPMGTPVLFTDMRDSGTVGLPGGWSSHLVEIPPRLLASMEYWVTVGLADPRSNGQMDVASNCLRFRIRDFSSSRGEGRLGYFGGMLPWSMTGLAAAPAGAEL